MMKKSFPTILLMNLLLASVICLQAKEWRGITPFRSSKTDVDRILGKPLHDNASNAVYSLTDEEVEINFSTKSSFQSCLNELPAQTVLNITVVPKKELKLSEFPIDEKTYTNFEPPLRKIPGLSAGPYKFGDVGYLDKKEGVVVRGYQGSVLATRYFAAAKDRNLCEDYNYDPESFGIVYIDILVKWYLNKSAPDDDIWGYLHSCAYEISHSPLFNCVVSNSGTDQEVAKRVTRITKLLKKSKFDIRRFKFVRSNNNQPISTIIAAYPIGEPPKYLY